MDASYRRGLSVVLSIVLASAGLCTAASLRRSPPARAGEDLGGRPLPLGDFRLTERSGRTISQADLEDKVWIASFIFTHCPLSCPRITSLMKGIQGQLTNSSVQLVSLTVDPDRDSPQVLSAYARKFDADPDRWWFLTGPKAELEGLIVDRFKLGLATASPEEQAAGAEAISHSARLALVDRGNRVVGIYDTTDPSRVAALVAAARKLAPESSHAPAWARRLPAVNATLNALSGVLLVVGWTLIRLRLVRAHAICMSLCVAASTLFLGCYLVYHYEIGGGVPFRGVGPIRIAYFTILLSHVILAVVLVPLVVMTLVRAIRRQFVEHGRIARVTFPIWLYVSITGVVVYVMLYQLPLATSTG